MPNSVTLTEDTRSRSVSLGRPYRYDVFGVAGRITLGERAFNTHYDNGRFRQKLLGLIALGSPVDSTAYVWLQTGLTRFYPEQLSVTGGSAGITVGPVHRYGPNWTLCDPRNPAEVNLSFHLAGSTLLGALLPGILSPAHYNLNPSGHFYVLGEYHAAPPVMTGSLSVSSNSVLWGAALPLTYRIERNELPPVYRPPFLGLDLGDIGLTVLGTPPGPANGTGGPVDLPDIQMPDLVSVTIDLGAPQGEGWLRIQRSP